MFHHSTKQLSLPFIIAFILFYLQSFSVKKHYCVNSPLCNGSYALSTLCFFMNSLMLCVQCLDMHLEVTREQKLISSKKMNSGVKGQKKRPEVSLCKIIKGSQEGCKELIAGQFTFLSHWTINPHTYAHTCARAYTHTYN